MLPSTSGVTCQEKELWEVLTILCRKERFDTVLSEKRQLVDAISTKKGSLAAISENIYQLAMRGLEELVKFMEMEIQEGRILTPYLVTDSNKQVAALREDVVLLERRFIEWTRKVLIAVDYGWSLNITGAGAADAKANAHSIVEEIKKAWTETVTVMEVAFKLSSNIIYLWKSLPFRMFTKPRFEAIAKGWVVWKSWKNDQGIEEIQSSNNVPFRFPLHDLQDPKSAPAIEATQKAIVQMKQVKSIMESAAHRFRLLMFPPWLTSLR
jgi:hypothetical protein